MLHLGDLIVPAPRHRAGSTKLPILSMTMRGGLVDQSTKFKKRIASVDTSEYKVVRRGQLVVGFPIDEGVLSIQGMYDEAIVSPAYDIWNIRAHHQIEPMYLERLLRSPRALAFYRAKLRGTTARRRTLPDDVFLTLPIWLPNLEEQRVALSLLNQIDTLHDKRQETVRLVDQYVRAVFIDMFGDPDRNPHKFPIGTIRDLVKSANYGTSEKANDESGRFPILRMGNITYEGGWDMNSLKYVDLDARTQEKYLAYKGDLLFNRTNSKELVGKTAVYEAEQPMAIAGYLVRVRMNQHGNPYYVSGYLNSSHGKRTLEARAKSIVGMANINAQEMQDIPILIPPIELQERYALIVATTRLSVRKFQVFLDELEQLRSAIGARFFGDERTTQEAATC